MYPFVSVRTLTVIYHYARPSCIACRLVPADGVGVRVNMIGWVVRSGVEA